MFEVTPTLYDQKVTSFPGINAANIAGYKRIEFSSLTFISMCNTLCFTKVMGINLSFLPHFEYSLHIAVISLFKWSCNCKKT